MAAYALFRNLTVTNAEGLATYRSKVRPIVESFGGRIIVGGGEWETVEGCHQPPPILSEWPDLDSIRRWYNSKEYRPLRDLRHRSATYYAIFMAGTAPAVVVES
jgi:uncharacterized protein (DUF1330 family)